MTSTFTPPSVFSYETPPTTSGPTVPPPPPSAPGPSSRLPMESAKKVLSAELFQRRHALEFAHLHEDADSWELKAEESILAEERRIGRMRRENQAYAQEDNSVKGTRARSVDGAKGRRPLSLVQKREQGHTRSKTELGLGIDLLNRSPVEPTFKSRPRPGSASSGLRPLSLRSSLVSPRVSPRPSYGPDDQTLEVLIERESTSSPDQIPSELDHSISHSTYSWATSFSGETTDLRTAAHYVPSRAVTPDADESVEMDSPARKEQRRKRIIAIAHTVRQLEGVGSRDLEDPAFYSVLAKAWYERFDDKRRPPPLGPPPLLPATPADAGAPFVPDSESSHMALRRFQLPEGASPAEQFSSPPDPEFKTPGQGFEFSSVHQDYPRPKSMATSVASRSIRYSYASTLHDLEGVLQGAKLMREKPWLRPTSNSGTPWGGDFDMPPNLRLPTPDAEDFQENSWTSSLDSPFEYDRQIPARMLRRVEGVIERPIKQRVVSDEKEALDSPKKIPTPGEAGASRWPTGFVNAWWDFTPNTAHPSPNKEVSRGKEDFPFGEDGNIPRDSILSLQSKTKKSMSTSSAVLEPEYELQQLVRNMKKSSISPSDMMFIDTLFRVPSRRRSCISPRHRRLPIKVKARPLSDPGKVKKDIRNASESVFSNLYPVNSRLTRSITSSLRPQGQQQMLQTAPPTLSAMQKEGVSVTESEEDGSIGLETLSLRSISPLPTPPLDSEFSLSPRSLKKGTRPILSPLNTTYTEETTMKLSQPVLLDPPPRIQSIQHFNTPGTLELGSHPSQLTFPTPTISGQPIMLHPTEIPSEVEEVIENMQSEVYCGIASQPQQTQVKRTLSNSQHHLIGLWSSPPELAVDTASPAAIVLEAEIPGISQPDLPSQGNHGDNHEAQTGHPSRPAPTPVVDEPMNIPTGGLVAVMENPRKANYQRTSTKALFWLGFICPLLWLIGAWMSSSTTITNPNDVEQGTVSAVMEKGETVADMPWYRRWTYDPDRYIERCRWAIGVTIPLAVIGGVTAGIVVALV